MTTALLECLDEREDEHVKPCVISLACWWREVREVEELVGYHRSSLPARDAWDAILASEIPAPCEALYVELRDCVEVWRRISHGQPLLYPSILERLVSVAALENLPLPQYKLLAAFRLRQRLCGMRTDCSCAD